MMAEPVLQGFEIANWTWGEWAVDNSSSGQLRRQCGIGTFDAKEVYTHDKVGKKYAEGILSSQRFEGRIDTGGFCVATTKDRTNI